MTELQLSIENAVKQRAMFYSAPWKYVLGKRVFDILVSFIGIVLFSAVFVIIAISIKLTTRGLVFDISKKTGLNGRIFRMYKFNITKGTRYGRMSTARDQEECMVTPIGCFLRAFKLDDLPKLLNVLKGDMSIVGPKPHSVHEILKYDSWHKLRMSVQPGIISAWQASGRECIGFDEMVRQDLKYIRERGFWLDTKVILKTVLVTKRNIDFLGAVAGIIILLPVFIFIGLIIKLTSKGNVFFRHNRVGQFGNVFGVYKFRTMVPDAEQRIKQFTPEQMEEFQKNFKLMDDPRVTKIGKLLRKTSLDELPQIINILKGEMSIVGPRPVTVAELEKYGDSVDEVLSVRPGLTGMWQANGRSDTTYDERVQMDIDYIHNMGLRTDIKIIIQTVITVLKREGAY